MTDASALPHIATLAGNVDCWCGQFHRLDPKLARHSPGCFGAVEGQTCTCGLTNYLRTIAPPSPGDTT